MSLSYKVFFRLNIQHIGLKPTYRGLFCKISNAALLSFAAKFIALSQAGGLSQKGCNPCGRNLA